MAEREVMTDDGKVVVLTTADEKALKDAGWALGMSDLNHWNGSSATGDAVGIVRDAVLAINSDDPLEQNASRALLDRDRLIKHYEAGVFSDVDAALLLGRIAGLCVIAVAYGDKVVKFKAEKDKDAAHAAEISSKVKTINDHAFLIDQQKKEIISMDHAWKTSAKADESKHKALVTAYDNLQDNAKAKLLAADQLILKLQKAVVGYQDRARKAKNKKAKARRKSATKRKGK